MVNTGIARVSSHQNHCPWAQSLPVPVQRTSLRIFSPGYTHHSGNPLSWNIYILRESLPDFPHNCYISLNGFWQCLPICAIILLFIFAFLGGIKQYFNEVLISIFSMQKRLRIPPCSCHLGFPFSEQTIHMHHFYSFSHIFLFILYILSVSLRFSFRLCIYYRHLLNIYLSHDTISS